MTVDRGGMDYKITLEDTSAAGLLAFRANVKAARDEFKAFKTELRARSSSAQQAQDLERLAAAARRAGQEATRQAAATQRAAVVDNQRSRAIKDANAAFDKKFKADQAASVSAERNYATERRAASATRQRAQAEDAITKVLERRARSENLLAAARERGVNLSSQEQRTLGLLSNQEKSRLASVERLAAAKAKATDATQLQAEAETKALKVATKAKTDLAAEQILADQGLDKHGQQITRPEDPSLKSRIKDFLGLGQSIGDAEGHANRASFTFRRLFGILAAFTAVRVISQLFVDGVKGAVLFNAQLETAEQGIAGIIAGTARIRDLQGQNVDAATAFAIAQGEARKQVEALRKDALLTTASFEDLVQAFQVGLASGLSQGLSVDQVRVFTRNISQAAQAIGLAQNQLSEEIRSVLTGTINPRNTRIAQALGITNEDIARAKEQGQLFEFLQKKLSAFEIAGRGAAQTLPGLFNRVKSAVEQLLGAGAKGLTDQLKVSLAGVLADLVQIDQTGHVIFTPQAVEVVAIIAEGVGQIVQGFQTIKASIGFTQAKVLATALANVLQIISVTISNVVAGALDGVALILGAVQGVRNAVLSIAGIDIFDNRLLRASLKTMGLFIGIALSISALIFGLGAGVKLFRLAFSGALLVADGVLISVKGITAALTSARAAAAGIGIASSPLLGIFAALLVAIAAVAFAIDQLREHPFVDLSNTKAVNQTTMGLVELQQAAHTLFRELKGDPFEQVVADASKAQTATEELFNSWQKKQDGLSDVIDKTSKKFQDLFSNIVKQAKGPEDPLKGIVLASAGSIEELKTKLQELTKQAREARDAALAQIATVGLSSQVSQQALANETALQKARRDSLSIERDRQNILKAAEQLQIQIDTGAITDADKLNEAKGRYTALIAQAGELELVQANVREHTLRIATAEILALSKAADFETRQNNALLQIEAVRARELRLAQQTHDERRAAVLLAEQELATTSTEGRQKVQQLTSELDALKKIISTTQDRVDLLQKIPELERTIDDKEGLDIALQTRDSLAAQAQSLRDQIEFQRTINAEKRDGLQTQLDIAKLEENAPIATGIVEAFGQAFTEVADTFKTTLSLMSGAIKGFSSFVAESLVSAFDPSSDQTIQQRFGQFLQSLATQIIETLVTLAITAAVLNAASGGLLGPLLQEFAVARGFNGGGGVGFHEGGRPGRGATRHRARGFNEGGKPGDFRVHGVDRPAGLHPADTIPIWTDPTEWVVRGAAVRKIGDDFMDRFNDGDFDPMQLRAAIGLDAHRKLTRARVGSGNGFAAGGPTSRASTGGPSVLGQASGRPAVTIVVASEREAEKIYKGGGAALDRALADRGIYPNSRGGR